MRRMADSFLLSVYGQSNYISDYLSINFICMYFYGLLKCALRTEEGLRDALAEWSEKNSFQTHAKLPFK